MIVQVGVAILNDATYLLTYHVESAMHSALGEDSTMVWSVEIFGA